MEPHVPAYEKDGTIPMRTGSAFTGSAPNNLYPTADGANILIAANNDSVFNRLAKAIGRVDLLQSTLFNSQKARAENCDAIDAEISDWTMRHQSAEIESILDQNGVPASKILTIADIFNHPHYHARQMLERVKHSRLGSVTLAGIVPKLSETPGAIRWAGGAVGEHTVDVLAQTLGYSPQYIAELIDRGVICSNKDETSEQNYNIDLTRGAEKS
jgi:crotonobetainyl-CoA:carnitine CoA-transferase CaiB-like acyl-CoA transferase